MGGIQADPMIIQHLAFILLLVGTQAFFTWLAIVNLRHSEGVVESEAEWLAKEFEIDDADELLGYQRLGTGFAHLQAWIGLLILFLVLYSGVFTEVIAWVDGLDLGLIGEGVFVFVGLVVAITLYSMPYDAIGTFVVDELFDFNQQTVILWIRDALVGITISIVLVAIIAAAVMAFVMWLGWWWWVAGWAFVVLFSLAMNVIYPRVIAPLFNEFIPVQEGELRDAVEEVFDRAGFECSQIYTMDASRRSSKVNAYFVGFGRTKRVVLFDTLVEKLDTEAIQSVLAHELAHWKRKHIWKGLGSEALRLSVVFAILGYLVGADWVYAMFDIDSSLTYAGIILAVVWVTPLVRWSSPLSNRVWLSFEREADAFATEIMGSGEGLVTALTELTRENLSNPFPHPWYEAFHYDHPPVPDRIRALRSDGES